MDLDTGSHLQWTELHGRLQELEKVFDNGSHPIRYVHECKEMTSGFQVLVGVTRQ